jgi:rod shape determining protein RodA
MIKKFSILYGPVIIITLLGLSALFSFDGQTESFYRQLLWIVAGVIISFLISKMPLDFLKKNTTTIILYGLGLGLLALVLVIGTKIKGSQSWIDFGFFSFQPSDMMKLFFIMLLAKYLSRRHVEIADTKHIVITAIYLLLSLGLIMMQPDFGSGVVLGFIWFGMLLVSGISRKHLLGMVIIGTASFGLLWGLVFKPYQKARIINFIAPASDIRGSGYNVYQSMIAVGSGQVIGKGAGLGTQSRLSYLPEYKTDFIFAAFSEEWGFIGSILLIILYGTLLWMLIHIASVAGGNFESLFTIGFIIMLLCHIMVNIGMNIGIMPVTGIPLPFMSYGGSHVLAEFIGLGIIFKFFYSGRSLHRDTLQGEFDSLE